MHMADPRILRIYLEPDELKRARDGKYNLMNRIKTAFEWQGFRVDFMRDSVDQRLKSATRRGYSLFFMQDPFHARALNIRRAYYFPFWRIENTAERWEFDVAKKHFDPGEIDTDIAQKWAGNWRRWLFKNKAANPVREGIVYVPLQGKLLERRSFQQASPLEMIDAVLQHDQKRAILVGLHPGEVYSDQEMTALEEKIAETPRLTLQKGGMEEALRVCDYVVTQNSSVALSGFFFHKPAILFAKIDFHHIGIGVEDMGVKEALERVISHQPDFDKYLYWFIQLNSIKADNDEAGDAILDAVRGHGWRV